MGECINLRRGGKQKKLPILNANYPADVSTTYIDGNTASASFKVEIITDGYPIEYTYQWYLNGSAVSGATGASYTWSGTEGTYSVRCDITNKAGTVQSRTATLSVVRYYKPTLNSSYPADFSAMTSNGSTTFKVEFANHGNPANYTYQWYWDGEPLSWAKGPTFNVSLSHGVTTFTIYCEVTNAAGTVRSRTATLVLTDTYLYSYGNEYNGVTGGWQVTKTLGPENTAYGLAILEHKSDHLRMEMWTADGFVGTVNKIDLTYYSKIRFYMYLYSDDADYPWYVVAASHNNPAGNYIVAQVEAPYGEGGQYAGYRTIDLDISGLSGSYYVGLRSWMYNSHSYALIYSVQLLL